MGKRFGLEFEGFEELISTLENLGADVEKATEEALYETRDHISAKLLVDMDKHHRTGKTKKSIAEDDKVEWEGSTASIPVGFHISDGGLPSVFLMYGTPRMKKDTKLYNDIYGAKTKKEVNEIQQNAISKTLVDALGG